MENYRSAMEVTYFFSGRMFIFLDFKSKKKTYTVDLYCLHSNPKNAESAYVVLN